MGSFDKNSHKFGSNNNVRRQSRVAAPTVESVENRELLAAPAMNALSQLSVPGGKTLFVPLSSTTSDNSAVTYSVTSSDPAVKTSVISGGTYIKMSVNGYGDMVFKLFDNLAPTTVDKIKSLVQQGFYDGLTFHRVIQNFMIQGGDPAGNGTGGPGFTFADEFNSNAIFTGTGQLAMANSGSDTNGSQFFVTTGPQRSLDFKYTIFGQMVQGFDVLNKIQAVPTSKTDVPLNPVVINKAQVIADNTDAVLQLQAPAGESNSQLTITATGTDGDSSTQSVSVTGSADTVNDPPFLGTLKDLSTPINTPVTFTLNATDLENDQIESSVVAGSNANQVTITTNGSEVTVTPKTGFSGSVKIIAAVRQAGSTAWQMHGFNLTVTPPPVTATALTNKVQEGTATGDQVVAWFTDSSNANATAASYGASISWGDGTASVGTVRPRLGGGFDVVGNHTYTNEGTYATTVYVGDPGADGSAATVKSLTTGQYVATDAPLVAKGVTPGDVVAGQPWTGVIATFSDTNPASPIGNYSAIIRWGDGGIDKAVSIVKNAAGTMDVIGQHTYANTGRKVAQVLIRDLGTSSTTAVSPIQISSSNGITPKPAPGTTETAPPTTPPPVATATPSTDGPLDPQTSGRLSVVTDSGSSNSDSITNLNKPQFDGQTAPGATVNLVATGVKGTSGSINLGTTTAGSEGKWILTSANTLPDGQYAVTVTVTRGTDVLTKTLLGGGTGSGSPLVIDTTAPQLVEIGYNQTTGQVRVNAQDYGSGLNNAAWSNSTNYSVIAASGRNSGGQINAASFRMVSTSAYPQATYNVILDRKFGPRPQRVQVTLNSNALTDVAGNAVSGTTTQVVGNSKIIKQLPKGVAQSIQNSRKNTSILNQIVNMILPTGARTKRF